MIHDLAPYRAYKDSGVEWLGDVPAHWDVRRLKRATALNPNKGEARSILSIDAYLTFLPMERVGADGRVDAREQVPASTVWSGFTYFRRDDVLVAKITPCFENGKGACLDALPTEVGFGSTEFHVLRATASILPQFLYRLTSTPEFRQLGAASMTGAAGQQRVPETFVANFLVPLPPLDEQAAIVRFLDHADRRIRRYIRAKQRLIALLKEQQQAITHRAVTRGLDPTVPLKPSGVEWLGDVPEHWRILPNRAIFTEVKERDHPEADMLSVTIAKGVTQQQALLEDSSKKDISRLDKAAYKLVRPGDIAYNKMRAWQGAMGVSGYDGIVSPAYVVQRPRADAAPRYLHHLLRTPAFAKEAERWSYGITSDMWSLRPEHFKMIYSCLPPLAEQTAIARFLDHVTADTEAAVKAAQREIDLLREYRTRLIADVVTGKLDVREAAARLPEEAEELEPLDEVDAPHEVDEASGTQEEAEE